MAGAVAEYWWAYLLLGLIGGIFSATFGVGSGAILIPVLVLLLDFQQKSAQGMCLAVMVPMALVGAIRYQMNPQITLNPGVMLLLACGAVVGAFIGAAIAGYASGPVLRKLFALILLVVAVRMFFSGPQPSERGEAPSEPSASVTPARPADDVTEREPPSV